MSEPQGSTLAIIGAGGHGKVVADAALLIGWKHIAFFDDAHPRITSVEHWAVEGAVDALLQRTREFAEFIVAIGDNAIRAKVQRRIEQAGIGAAVLIHPHAQVSPYATLGDGTIVLAGAVVNAFARLGDASIVNTGATVDHDNQLGEAVHVSPGAHLGGEVRIGDRGGIGIGAVIKHGLSLGADITVGAGAVVVKDLRQPGVYIGCPARRVDDM